MSDLDLVDVYSCFPSAVQVAAKELGLSLEQPLTVTGGLTFGGGPLNNYVMHSIARMVDLLRNAPGTSMYWSNFSKDETLELLRRAGFSLAWEGTTGHGYADDDLKPERHPLVLVQAT